MNNQMQLPGIETIFELKILWDNDPINPRRDGGLSTFCAWDRRFSFEDEGAMGKVFSDVYDLLTEDEEVQADEGYIDLDDPSTLYKILQAVFITRVVR